MTPIPVHLITGVDSASIQAATIALAFELPRCVTVRLWIDPSRALLHRSISDINGPIEHDATSLEDVCTPCTIREGLIPTLEMVAQSGTADTIVACLPVAATAEQVCRVCSGRPTAHSGVRVASVTTALDGASLLDDLTDGDLLLERELPVMPDDTRGLAETLVGMIEYADILALSGKADPTAVAMVDRLRRPSSHRVQDWSGLDVDLLIPGPHHHSDTETWMDPTRRPAESGSRTGLVWHLDLHSERPFHPERFLEEMENLGTGPHRIRGCVWFPTRPDDACVIDGAAGQVAVGLYQPWESPQQARTRVTVTGPYSLGDQELVEEAFRRCLLTDDEWRIRGGIWESTEDGLEPWLGAVHH